MPVNSTTWLSPACPAVLRMAQFSLDDELLNVQQEAIPSFMEVLEKVISQNSQHAQNLIDQCSNDLHKSIQEQVED